MRRTPDYLRDPDEIYRRSFEIVRAETDPSHLPAALHDVALRIVHACGMPGVAADLDWRGDPGAAGRAVLAEGQPVLADCRMVAGGVIRGRLPAGNAAPSAPSFPRKRESRCSGNGASWRTRASAGETPGPQPAPARTA